MLIESLLALGLLAWTPQVVTAEIVTPRITPEMRRMTKEEIKELVIEHLGYEMLSTIGCESGFRQYYDDGRVVRSHTNDVGIAQINVDAWEDDAKKLGHDIYTPIGNLLMAKHIKKVQGKTAWVCYQKLYGKT